MTATETEALGVAENTSETYKTERVVLRKGGLDVEDLVATLDNSIEEAKAANASQESLKRQLRAATRLAEVKIDRMYRMASSMIDMAMGAVEKTSDAAKNFQRIRSRVRRRGQDEQMATPVPLPVPNPAEE